MFKPNSFCSFMSKLLSYRLMFLAMAFGITLNVMADDIYTLTPTFTFVNDQVGELPEVKDEEGNYHIFGNGTLTVKLDVEPKTYDGILISLDGGENYSSFDETQEFSAPISAIESSYTYNVYCKIQYAVIDGVEGQELHACQLTVWPDMVLPQLVVLDHLSASESHTMEFDSSQFGANGQWEIASWICSYTGWPDGGVEIANNDNTLVIEPEFSTPLPEKKEATYYAHLIGTAPNGEKWVDVYLKVAECTQYNVPPRIETVNQYILQYEKYDNVYEKEKRSYALANIGVSDEEWENSEAEIELTVSYSDRIERTYTNTRYWEAEANYTSVNPENITLTYVYSDGFETARETSDFSLNVFNIRQTSLEIKVKDNAVLPNQIEYAGTVDVEGITYCLDGARFDYELTVCSYDSSNNPLKETTREGWEILTSTDSISIPFSGTFKFQVDNTENGEVYQEIEYAMELLPSDYVKVCPIPAWDEYEVASFTMRDIETKALEPIAISIEGGYSEEDTSDWTTTYYFSVGQGEQAGNSILYSCDIDREDMYVEAPTGYAIMKNSLPDGKEWLTVTLPIYDIKVYNTPKAPGRIVGVSLLNKVTRYACADLGMTDEELSNLDYRFLFKFSDEDSQDQTGSSSRYMPNTKDENGNLKQPLRAGTYWIYDDGTHIHSDYVNFDRDYYEVMISNHSFSAKRGGDIDGATYTGPVDFSSNGIQRTHAIARVDSVVCEVAYSYNDDSFINAPKTRFTLNGNQNVMGSADLSTNTAWTEFINIDHEEDYTMSIKAEINCNIDEGQLWYISSEESFDDIVRVHCYPQIPQIGDIPVQYRDVDGELDASVSAPSGANKYGWTYSASFNGEEKQKDPFTFSIPAINSDIMTVVTQEVLLSWTNSVEGEEWLTGSDALTINIYNTPEKPASLQAKGGENNKSGIYIASVGIPGNAQGTQDEWLADREYLFEFGDGENSESLIAAVDHRWYQYTSAPSQPWVRTLWKYDGFDCRSDIYSYNNESKSNDGEAGVGSIYCDESGVVAIYDMRGNYMVTTNVSNLRPGLYIVQRMVNGQLTAEKVIVK